jgi:hypothetical protein
MVTGTIASSRRAQTSIGATRTRSAVDRGQAPLRRRRDPRGSPARAGRQPAITPVMTMAARSSSLRSVGR